MNTEKAANFYLGIKLGLFNHLSQSIDPKLSINFSLKKLINYSVNKLPQIARAPWNDIRKYKQVEKKILQDFYKLDFLFSNNETNHQLSKQLEKSLQT